MVNGVGFETQIHLQIHLPVGYRWWSPLKRSHRLVTCFLNVIIFLFSLVDWAAETPFSRWSFRWQSPFLFSCPCGLKKLVLKKNLPRKGRGKRSSICAHRTFFTSSSYILVQSQAAAFVRKPDWLLKCPSMALFTSPHAALCPANKKTE